jgi:hypothetical protein
VSVTSLPNTGDGPSSPASSPSLPMTLAMIATVLLGGGLARARRLPYRRHRSPNR